MNEAAPQMTIGQILDRVYRLMRACWQLFLGIAVVPTLVILVPMFAAMAWWIRTIVPQITVQTGAQPHFPIYFVLVFFAANLLPIPVYAFYVPAGVYAAIQANLGVRVTVRQAYSVAWRHLGRYIWLIVLLFLYIFVPLAVVGALIGGGVFFILHGAQPGALPGGLFLLIPAALLAYFGIVVYAILIMLRFAVAYPAAVAENLSARAALRRSSSLTCGARGRIFLVLLAVYGVTYVASLLLMSAVGGVVSISAIAAMAAHVAAGSNAFYILIGLAGLIYLAVMVLYAALIYAAMNTALAVIYHDQRWRKDGVFPSALPA